MLRRICKGIVWSGLLCIALAAYSQAYAVCYGPFCSEGQPVLCSGGKAPCGAATSCICYGSGTCVCGVDWLGSCACKIY
jgi:hypothetical protein